MIEMEPETIGQRIKIRRRILRKRMAQIANETGVSIAAVSLWENDSATPGAARIGLLAQSLECDPAWLLTGGTHSETSTTSKPNDNQENTEFDKLKKIFDLLPRDRKSKVVDYAQGVLNDYHAEISEKIKKINAM
ncbi:TPA: helix-turn-helix domain-containing protein [Vibrio vulnificus]|nr:helix-turn-helix domain-containing protein [Vibrio vulnificus]